uniref:DUF803-domain-containing protein n=1 Tax=Mycena chlorophos TaxID=658473 RepID=A0ABQ0LTU1_MYCCL|nr:predicted protein [Mycena chlorophos]
MVDQRYVGVMLSVAASVAIGTSSVITKMGLTATAAGAQGKSATDGFAYLQNPIWWGGTLTLAVGEAANFAAYTFAPPVMITPLGALSVIIGAILASFILNEKLGHLGRVGCALCLLGTTIIVLHAPADQDIKTITQFLDVALEPGFMLYSFTAAVFSLYMIFVAAPRHGRTNPLVYLSVASVVGGVSIMFIKGFGVALKLTFEGSNQFVYPSTYLFAFISLVCIVVQLNYANKALDTFSVNLVNPLYYVGFCTATIISSLILFKGFNTTSPGNTVSLLCGFIVTFLGVHILNVALLDGAVEAGVEAGQGVRRSYGRLGGAQEEGLVRTPLFAAYLEEEQEEHEGVRMHRVNGSGSAREDIRLSPASRAL